MKDTLALEAVKKSYILGSPNNTVELKTVDSDLLKQMVKDCSSKRFIEERFEFYDDEDDDTFCNWIDVEGEGYGWIWLNKPPRKWHFLIRKHMLSFIRNKKQDLKDGATCYVVIIKNEDVIIYHFIEREENLSDTIYTFSDKKQL